ncbi:oligosaccharide flippase family protein [Acidimangrovimonas sediminis]|uniref:oligosaccharide flippase family protein n=1 Tax=Acidimangrovimonas sediminis TaxID=2056283 RepID=UPI000C7FCE88|nr:oligosaccharide flippase family protein [Acidimangrovimonas sediminis]
MTVAFAPAGSGRPAPRGGGKSRGPMGVVGGVASTLAANYAIRFVNLAITVIIARAVGPAGMGVVAAALLTIELIDTIRDFGLREALIYEPGLDRDYFSTAFLVIQSVSLVQACAMAGLGLFGPSMGLNPLLAALLIWLALLFPLSALASPQEAMLLRHGRFGRRALADVLAVVVKAGVAIALIAAGWEVWSIVAAMLASVSVRTAFLWLQTDWMPQLIRPSRRVLGGLARYGKHIVSINIMALARTKADQYLIAALMMPAALGTYFLAARIPEIAIYGVNVAITTVVFPTFSRIARETGDLRPAYLRALRASMLLMVPVSVGIAVISTQAVEVLFGTGWPGAATVLAILALGGIPLTLGWSSGDVFKATGRPELLTAVTVIEMLISLPVLVLVILVTRDLAMIALAMLACEVAGCAVRLIYMQRRADTPIADILRAVAPILGSAAVMGAAVLSAQGVLGALPPVPRLGLSVALGIAVYAVLIMLTDRKSVAELRQLLKRVPPTAAPANPEGTP